MSKTVIKIKGLNKSYGRINAVSDLDLEVEEASVFGFLGPNGAGKTTVIKILLGLVVPRSGEVEIFGRDLFRERDMIMKNVGAVVEAPALFEYMTASENLFYLAKLSGGADRAAVERTIQTVGLEQVADRKVKTFSYGMKQRLGIAQALLPQSSLIFLDEPSNGLDPHGIVGVRKLIRKLSRELGITVFLSSHWLSEVEQICDEVVIIDKGVKVCESAVSDLVRRHSNLALKTPDIERFRNFAEKEDIRILELKGESDIGLVVFEGAEEDVPGITAKLVGENIRVLSIGKHENSLEGIFVSLTGKDQADFVADRF